MGRMGKTSRVENRGETTRGERTRGETSWGQNVLLPFWAGCDVSLFKKIFFHQEMLLIKHDACHVTKFV